MPMDLSVLIITYNSAPLIDGLLDYLQAEADMQRASLSMEVIVVDNHSADATVQVVREKHPWVHLIASDTNLGFAAGNNLAARKAQGEYLLLLNPDAMPDPGSLGQAVRMMRDNPQVGLGGGQLRDVGGDLQPSARMFPTLRDEFFTLTGLAAKYPHNRWLARLDRRWADANAVADVDWIPGAFVFIPSRVFERLGGFDERFFMYYEEVDFCRKLRADGLKVRYWPMLGATHIGGASAKTVSQARVSRAGSQLELWRMRSALLYYRKHHGALAVALQHGIERGWYTLRLLRSRWRGQGDKANDLAMHTRQLQQAWADTQAGRVSPQRPW